MMDKKWLLEPGEMAQAKTKTSFVKYPWNEYGITAAEISIRNSTAKKIAEKLDKKYQCGYAPNHCYLYKIPIDDWQLFLKEIEES